MCADDANSAATVRIRNRSGDMVEGERPVAGSEAHDAGAGGKTSHIEGFAGMPSPEEQTPREHTTAEGPGYALDAHGTREIADGGEREERTTPIDG